MAGPVLQMNARERRLLGVLGLRRARSCCCSRSRSGSRRSSARIAPTTTTCGRRSPTCRTRAGASASGRPRRTRSPRATRKKAPALAGFLEQTARQQKLEVTDSTPLPDVPARQAVRRARHATSTSRRRACSRSSRFLEALEKSGYPVAVTRLNIRKRSGEPDSYDVEVGVSSYDRTEAAPAAPAGSAKP